MGDEPSKYSHKKLHKNPLTGQLQFILEHKPNGDCFYLGESGCTIYNDRPAICAKFDCRRMYKKLTEDYTPAQLEQMVEQGYLSHKKIQIGKDKLVTLGKQK